MLTSSDRYAEAGQVFMAGRAAAEATGAVTTLTIHHVGIALLAYTTGQWDDAVAELESGIALAEDRGTVLGMTWHWSVWARSRSTGASATGQSRCSTTPRPRCCGSGRSSGSTG